MSTEYDIIEALRILRRALPRAASTVFAKAGVSASQVMVLRELRRAGAVSQVELSRATATDPAATMRAVDLLEDRGWVQRSSSESDRRRKLVSLTAHGRRALLKLDPDYEALNALLNSGLTRRERELFFTMARKLAAAIEGAANGAATDDGTGADA